MAGFKIDSRLGSCVAELGGLHVMIPETHEAAWRDRQLVVRLGRRGDPDRTDLCYSLKMTCCRRDSILVSARNLSNSVV